jgi:hypothetical protein
MTNPTSNFGWQMPTSTDLVTDLPADFEVFGQAVDTSLADLKGGTTGQVLAKNSNTDMDFIWTAGGDITAVTAGTGISGGGTSGDVTITNAMATAITTNGDLIYGTGSGTFTRRGIGTTGQILTVSGGVPAWVSPAGGGKVLQVVMGSTSTNVSTSSGTYSDTGLTATITPSATTSKVLVLATQNGCFKNTTTFTGIDMILVRNGSQIIQIAGGAGSNGVAENNLIPTIATSYLDSPASTSALTYKTQFRVSNGGTVGVQRNAEPTSSIILLEIGA